MVVFPIVGRELSVASRRKSTYWLRVIAVIIATTTCVWVLKDSSIRWSTPRGGHFVFTTIVQVLFYPCLIAGLFTTADSISSESRQGTLGLLFLTDLSGRDVVLGKMAVTSLNAFYALIAVLPVLAIPMVLGGVTAPEVLRAAVTLFGTLLLSLSVGLFVSSFSRTEGEAVLGTFLVIVGTCIVPPILGEAVTLLNRTGAFELLLGRLIGLASPWIAMRFATSGEEIPLMRAYGTVVAVDAVVLAQLVNFVWCCVLLLITAKITRNSWRHGWGEFNLSQTRPAVAPRERARQEPDSLELNAKRLRRIARVRQYRRSLLGINPILWLAHRDPLRTTYVWSVVVALGLIWLWGRFEAGPTWWQADVACATMLVVHSIMKWMIAFEAPRQILEDRKTGAMELLLCTPLTDDQLIRGHLLALVRQFARPIALIFAVEGLVLFLHIVRVTDYQHQLGKWMLAYACFFLLDVVTLAVYGLWLGLKAKSSLQASVRLIVLVMFIPWLAYWAHMMTTGWWVNSLDRDAIAFYVWVLVGFLVDVTCLLFALIGLNWQIRSLAGLPPRSEAA